jgi:hypothetical protein
MNVQKTKEVFANIFKEANLITIIGIIEENHSPHQFHIDEQHKNYAKDTNDGELDEDILEMFPCGLAGCKLSYPEHKAERKLMLQINKDLTEELAQKELVKIQPHLNKYNVARVAFVEGEEGYKFLKNGEDTQKANHS